MKVKRLFDRVPLRKEDAIAINAGATFSLSKATYHGDPKKKETEGSCEHGRVSYSVDVTLLASVDS